MNFAGDGRPGVMDLLLGKARKVFLVGWRKQGTSLHWFNAEDGIVDWPRSGLEPCFAVLCFPSFAIFGCVWVSRGPHRGANLWVV